MLRSLIASGLVLWASVAWAGPLAPMSPSGAVAAADSVRLTWQAVPDATEYLVRASDETDPAYNTTLRDSRNNCPGTPPPAVYLCVNFLTTTSIVLPVRPGHTYQWWVHYRAPGTSLSTAEIAFFTIESSPLTLTWVDNATDEDAYKVERRLEAESVSAYMQVVQLGPNVESHVDSSVTFGAAYCYRVRAANAAGDSPYSNEACGVSGQPGAPTTLTVTDP
jgi:hypothetical protein